MFKRDINIIESVQRRFTRRLSDLYNFSYSCRLAWLGLDSLYCKQDELGGYAQKCLAPTVKHTGQESRLNCAKFSKFDRFCGQSL